MVKKDKKLTVKEKTKNFILDSPKAITEEDSKRIQELKHDSRRHSIKEGIFASAKTSFGDYYISPLAIAINMSNPMIALLGSISGLLGPLSQTFSSRLIEKYPRKKIVRKAVFLESLVWILFATIAILFYKELITTTLPILLLITFSIYVIISNIATPAWFSWMGDIVDEKYRGRWFSKRTIITGFVSLILTILAAFFLDYLKKNNWLMFGFITLFSLAFLSRLLSWNVFKRQYEPKIKLKKGYYFSFPKFLLKAPKNNFGKLSIFRAILSFSIAISGPLLAIYLLRYLNFNYPTYIIVILAGTLFSILVLNLWGRFADKYGNYRVMYITSFIIPIIPILWILNPSPIYLILVPSFLGGVAWAGFNLATGNFIYDNVSKEKRGLAISYYNLLNGIGIFLGASLSAILIKFLTISFIEPLFAIFILSTIARIITIIWWIPKLKEVKEKEKFNSSRALKNLILKEAKPIFLEEAHEIMEIKNYLREK